ncbi:MAG TPA: hypothetical protein PKH65_07495 [Bacteroidia bacterium]|nr:hypothetical protein [Bacteroidia bacterium]
MKIIPYVILFFAIATINCSCKKHQDNEAIASESAKKIIVSYSFDGVALTFDSMLYYNLSGNLLGVSHLEYYVSDIVLTRSNGEQIIINKEFYVDARKNELNSIDLGTIPDGEYTSITFYVGLDSSKNQTGFLPPTTYNINMAWPVGMGGGYHFMKLEGHFVEMGNTYGYAIHLGNNYTLVQCTIHQNFNFSNGNTILKLDMNLSEWFKNPYSYNLNVDPNYTMGDSTAMTNISHNGTDVFTIKTN